jgi:predicted CopG family antitoxin
MTSIFTSYFPFDSQEEVKKKKKEKEKKKERGIKNFDLNNLIVRNL